MPVCCVAQLVREVDRQSKDPGSNPDAVESVSFSTERFLNSLKIDMESTRRKKSDYNSKSTSHAFVAGFVLAIMVKKSYILSRDPFMLKK